MSVQREIRGGQGRGSLLNDDRRLVRGHAAWALGEVGIRPALDALREHLESEEDEWVREEIEIASSS